MPFVEIPEQDDDAEWSSDTEEALMAASMTISEGFAAFGLAEVKSLAFTGTGGSQLDEVIPASTSNHPIVFTLDISAIKALYIIADGDMLLETNSSGSPADDISLLANQPLIWYTGSYHANPFGTDITALYGTNAAATAVNLYVRVVTDATP